MDRKTWLEERRSGIGGSDVAALLGISPFKTAVDVWLDKTGQVEPDGETEAMRIGMELEDYVARRYCEETGSEVRRHNKMIHDGCLLANVDRLVVPAGEKIAAYMGEVRTNKILECKTSSRDWENGVPLYYQTQVQHYMGLLPTVESVDVAVLFLVHKHFETHTVERDADVIAAIQSAAREWWQKHIVEGATPPPTCEADCKALYARSNPGKSIETTDEITAALAEFREADKAAKEAADRAKAARSRVMAHLADAEVLVGLDGKPLATWKSAKDSSKTDWEAVARCLGASDAIIEAHTTTTAGARRFVCKT